MIIIITLITHCRKCSISLKGIQLGIFNSLTVPRSVGPGPGNDDDSERKKTYTRIMINLNVVNRR